MTHTITHVAAEPGCTLRLTYASGEVVRIDLTGMIGQRGVFADLADPEAFARVTLGERGRYVEWPSGVDLCADALWLAVQRQDQAGIA